jgi:hypothetical protein
MNTYLQQIQICEKDSGDVDTCKHTTGGFPILSTVSGGKSNGGGYIDGTAKIQHLSIPMGLVLLPTQTYPCPHHDQDPEYLEDDTFDKLLQSVLKHSSVDTSEKTPPSCLKRRTRKNKR